MKLAVAYGSTFGDTADAAERIAEALRVAANLEPDLLDIAYAAVDQLADYEVLILGCSTWHVGELQSDWASKIAEFDRLDLRGKRVALFGMGDQLGYPDTFQDALGILTERLEAAGTEPLGAWPAKGYRHEASRAQRGDRFVGLALDDTNEWERTGARIERWVAQVIEELGLAGPGDVLAAR